MIYRVHPIAHTTTDSGDDGSLGYSYFGSKAEASRFKTEVAKDKGIPRNDIEIESRPTPKTKAEWLKLLNEWGGHPDNG